MKSAKRTGFGCLIAAMLVGGTSTGAKAQVKALLLFGGRDHKTFIGCLNCGNVASESVCNAVGSYGSPVASDSIWNQVGTFGSQVSPTSPWNEVASDAPIIVDSDGRSYGYFSANHWCPN
jgi:hypothetical protein